jgi:hypothetical protein
MKTFTILFVLFLAVVLLNCGTNHEKEGEAAFLNKDYTTAINHFKQALPNSLNKEGVREKLALSYFYRGEELFAKTRNLKAFVGNFEQAEQNLPEYPNEAFGKEYSRIMYELGKAYSVSKPKNELEEDEFYKNSLDLLNAAIYVDSTNMDAAQLIVKIKDDSFNKLLETAEKYYNQANRSGKVDLYLSSEYYLKQAAEYKPTDPGVVNLFKKIKRKTLAVLNYRDGVSLAVSKYGSEKDGILLNITVKNYLGKPVEFNTGNIMLVARDGIKYGVDEDAMRVRKLFGENVLENTTLDSNKPYVEGKLVINAPGDAKIAYLSYKYGRRQESRKYFP